MKNATRLACLWPVAFAMPAALAPAVVIPTIIFSAALMPTFMTPAHSQPAPTPAPGAVSNPAPSATAPKRSAAPKDAYVYIGWPNDGEVIRSTRIKIWFGTRNFGVAPAGTSKANTGHHHVLIDVPLPPLDEPIPNDRNHLHFGLGQTEAYIELPPGTHTLQLLMGDADHVPHDPPVMSKKITVHVRVAEVQAQESR